MAAITLYKMKDAQSDEIIYVYDKRGRYKTGDILVVSNTAKTFTKLCKVRAVTKAFLATHGISKVLDKQLCASEKLLSEFGDISKDVRVYELALDKQPVRKSRSQAINNTNYDIALNIVKAQIASDIEKNVANEYRLKTHHVLKGRKTYGGKTKYILNAIKRITNENADFNFYIYKNPDQTGRDSMIVIFDTYIDGYVQISFHIPLNFDISNATYEIYDLIGIGDKIDWDPLSHNRKSCEKLIEKYDI